MSSYIQYVRVNKSCGTSVNFNQSINQSIAYLVEKHIISLYWQWEYKHMCEQDRQWTALWTSLFTM